MGFGVFTGGGGGSTYVHPATHPVTMITGLVDSYTVGTGGINAGQVVFITASNTIQAANSANQTHAGKVVGISLADGLVGDSVKVQKTGSITCSDWNLSPGQVYYLGSGGDLVTVVPTAGFVQKVGVAETATKFVLQIESAVILD